ncbi:MAG: methyltransferase [Flavobacterium sp. BFFFF2]|nr:MAG: methyltransferase [Flavobacterium sp. BFFFF2]
MNIWFRLQSYLIFWWRSSNQHGVHSPFVFRWVTQCLYAPKSTHWKTWMAWRKQLLSATHTFELTDFGAKSSRSESNFRTQSQLVRWAGTSPLKAQLLIQNAAYFQPKTVLELGTSLGLGTYAFHLGNPESQITTLEGDPAIQQHVATLFKQLHCENIVSQCIQFQDWLCEPNLSNSFDLIFFDGHHQGDAMLRYAKQLLRCTHEGTLWIWDDIYWSVSMKQAWDEVCTWPEVTVSVDTFHLGFLFFRTGQAKEHFVIRV